MPAPLLVPAPSQMGVPTLKRKQQQQRLCQCHDSKKPDTPFRRSFSSFSRPRVPPVDRIPDEIASQIFLFATADTSDRLDATLLPLTFSHVSSRWRRVALATSSLWTKITIVYPPTSEQLSRSAHWISRSRTQPLDIILDFRDPSWDWELSEADHDLGWRDVDTILRLLLAHVKRWKRFELLSDTWLPIFAFLCYTRDVTSGPLLEGVHLFRCNAYFANIDAVFSPREMKTPIPFFGGKILEKLTDVTLAGVHVDWAASSLQNLQTLELKYLASDVAPPMDEFKDILAACPNLRRLSIGGRGPQIESLRAKESDASDSSKLSETRIRLLHLSDLSIGFTDPDHAVQLLNMFIAPNIRKLSLQGMFFDLGFPFPRPLNAAPLLTRLHTHEGEAGPTFPFSKLASLVLEDIDAPAEVFAKLFDDLHDLQSLTLHRITNNSLHALSPNELSPLPCRNLAELNCYHQDPAVLLDVLQARLVLPELTQFQSISLTTTEDIPTAVMASLCGHGVLLEVQVEPDFEEVHSDADL